MSLRRRTALLAIVGGLVAAAAPAAHSSAAQSIRTAHVRHVSAALDLVDLDAHDKPFARQGGLSLPVLSGDGNHIAWSYDNDHEGHYGDYGLVWRDLGSGRTRVLAGTYPYSLDLARGGRYVAYSRKSASTPSGQVTSMAVYLWDTATGKQTIINRRSPTARSDDGISNQVRISADASTIVFHSTSQSLMPAGLHGCTPFVNDGCREDAGYIYAYDRHTHVITPVPTQASFTPTPALVYPVVSGDGNVVAFRDDGQVEVWYRSAGIVRRLSEGTLTCSGDPDDLSLSEDGATLAANCDSATVIRLGGPTGTDQVLWKSQPYDQYIPTTALSADGSTLVFFGARGSSPRWSLWPVLRVDVAHGTVTAMPAPGRITGLKPASPYGQGMALDRATISSDGRRIAAVTCSIAPPQPGSQTCPKRMDVFRWTVPG